jgi:hypothetical protein
LVRRPLAAPLVLAWLLRGRTAWVNVLWTAWAYALILSASHSRSFQGNAYHRYLAAQPLFIFYAPLVRSDGRPGACTRNERLNLGVAVFAISVLFFHFDSFMGSTGRSPSLLVLGALCLAGGYALEITPRKRTARMPAFP